MYVIAEYQSLVKKQQT